MTLSISKILKFCTFFLILILSVTSFLDISSKYNYLNANLIFELLIVCYFLYFASSMRISKRQALVVAGLVAYLVISFILFMQSPNSMYLGQFFIIYKSIYYLTIMQFMIGKKLFDKEELRSLFYILICTFLIKYLVLHALNISYLENGHVRPGVFTENNYELIFLILIYYCISTYDAIFKLIPFFAMSFILILSGSKSALLAFLITTLFMNFKKFNQLKILFLIIATISLFIVLSNRHSGSALAEIDRIIFFTHFLNDINNFTLINYLFGTPPITQVSPATASSLSFYDTLFADKDTLEAFSVLYHSYILRVIYDHGFIGLAGIMSIVFALVSRCGYDKKVALSVLGIIIASGLSVSSLNSSFVTFGLILFITTYNNEKMVRYKLD